MKKLTLLFAFATLLFACEQQNPGGNSDDNNDSIQNPTGDIQLLPEGALCNIFSVGENKTVHFSKGNLQYQASTNTWRFAEEQ